MLRERSCRGSGVRSQSSGTWSSGAASIRFGKSPLILSSRRSGERRRGKATTHHQSTHPSIHLTPSVLSPWAPGQATGASQCNSNRMETPEQDSSRSEALTCDSPRTTG